MNLPDTGNAVEDAKELGRGLMRGHKPDLKLGWDWVGAVSAVRRQYPLTTEEALTVAIYLRGFGQALAAEEGKEDVPAIYAAGLQDGDEERRTNRNAYPASRPAARLSRTHPKAGG